MTNYQWDVANTVSDPDPGRTQTPSFLARLVWRLVWRWAPQRWGSRLRRRWLIGSPWKSRPWRDSALSPAPRSSLRRSFTLSSARDKQQLSTIYLAVSVSLIEKLNWSGRLSGTNKTKVSGSFLPKRLLFGTSVHPCIRLKGIPYWSHTKGWWSPPGWIHSKAHDQGRTRRRV